MNRSALPFTLRRSDDVMGASEMTTTTETVHGLLKLDAETLTIQWRLARRTDRLGSEIRIDREVESVREVVVPLMALAGAVVRRRWWDWPPGPRMVITAADLLALEGLTGPEGLRLAHPAELVLRIRRRDRVAAEEFAADVTLSLASLEGAGDPRLAPQEGGGMLREAPLEDRRSLSEGTRGAERPRIDRGG
jgi:hypothetical protein